jgi:hypothetical protein
MIRMQRLEEEKSGIMQDLMAHQKAVTEERCKKLHEFFYPFR